jgi:hypothetical protein
MPQKIEQFSRIINHRITTSGQTFTIPTSNDHTDETWSSTDLYIGEFGVNLTDDKVFVRTNNGIVELATNTASTATSSVWFLDGSDIKIDTGITADAIVRNTNSFVDLGTTTLRFKDLYLGGETDGHAVLNINTDFVIRDASQNLISSLYKGTGGESIQIGTHSSTLSKGKGLFLNSQDSQIPTPTGFAGERTIISSYNSIIGESNRNTIISGYEVQLADGLDNVVYIGQGRFRDYDYSDSLGVSGKLVIRNITDPGAGKYDRSEWVTTQNRVITSNANATPIVTLDWETSAEVVQLKCYLLGVDPGDASKVYSNEIFITAYNDGVTEDIIGDPIIKEVSSWSDDIGWNWAIDGTSFRVNVIGSGTDTMNWLCTYEYQRMVNLISI